MKKKELTILSIDDDPGCQRVAARFLTLAGGHLVEVAFSGEEGLKKARELIPDIILLDLNLPGMNGIEVMDALLTNPGTRGIPVIIVTGAVLSPEEERSLRNRPNFIQLEIKPFNLAALSQRLETTITAAPSRNGGRGIAGLNDRRETA